MNNDHWLHHPFANPSPMAVSTSLVDLGIDIGIDLDFEASIYCLKGSIYMAINLGVHLGFNVGFDLGKIKSIWRYINLISW